MSFRSRHLSLLSLVFLTLSLALLSFNSQASDYLVQVLKTERELLLLNKGKIIKRYPVAIGSAGLGNKVKTGDKKTPVGIYEILAFNDSSRFHLFMHLNYPNARDASVGLENGAITAIEYSEIIDRLDKHQIPPQDTDLGGSIGIHGIGFTTDEKLDIHKNENWTQGCVALTNDQVTELRQFVDIGTPVMIFD